MSEKKIIAVIGATGAQGGGLVRAILNDKSGQFAVRALTRKVDSDKARELARLGADVVAADLDNVDSLKKAFSGAFGAFCVTNFWEHFSPDIELTQARNMAEAAKAAGLKHVVWSTLEDTRARVPLSDDRMPTLQGKYKVPHFDAKGEADNIFRHLGVPTTFLLTSFYWDNFIHFGMGPKADQSGTLAITFPLGDRKMPGIAAEDIGKCAFGVFKQGHEYVGKTVGIAGEHLTGERMAAVFTQTLGQEVKYNAVAPEVFRSFGFPGADDLGNMFQYKRDFESEFCGARSIEKSRELNPSLQIVRHLAGEEQEPGAAGVGVRPSNLNPPQAVGHRKRATHPWGGAPEMRNPPVGWGTGIHVAGVRPRAPAFSLAGSKRPALRSHAPVNASGHTSVPPSAVRPQDPTQPFIESKPSASAGAPERTHRGGTAQSRPRIRINYTVRPEAVWRRGRGRADSAR